MPHLDSYLKTELSSATKSDDKELAKIQTFMLDALAPLTLILEADSEKVSYDKVIDATNAAVANWQCQNFPPEATKGQVKAMWVPLTSWRKQKPFFR